MATARVGHAWNHTATILAMVANVNRDPKRTRPFRPEQFHPHYSSPAKHRRRPVSVARLTDEIMSMVERNKGGNGR